MKTAKNWKIRVKIMLTVVLASVLISGGITIVSGSQLYKQVELKGSTTLEYLAFDNGGIISDVFKNVVSTTESIKNMAESSFDVDEHRNNPGAYMDSSFSRFSNEFLYNIIEANTNNASSVITGAYFTLDPYLTDPPFAMEVFYADTGNGPETQEDIILEDFYPENPDMNWFYDPFLSGKACWVSPYEDDQTGVYIVSYVMPVIINGETVGVAGADVSIGVVLDLLENIQVYETGFATLVDNYGNFFDTNPMVAQLSSENKNQLLSENLHGAGSIQMKISGQEYTVGYHIMENGYRCFFFAPDSEVHSEANSIIILISALMLAGIVVAVLCSIIIGRAISKPINDVAEKIEKLAEGDLFVQVSEDTLARADEAGRLARSERKLQLRLSYLTEKVTAIAGGDLSGEIAIAFEGDQIGNALNQTLETLNGTFSSMNDTAGKISSSSRSLADDSQTLAEGCLKQNKAVEALSEKIEEVTRGNSKNADMLQELMEVEGRVKVNADHGNARMANLAKAVLEIQTASDDVHKILKVIDDIAFQTNILALNAAVEAARAGQNGKGFAVVADEVRNLAAKSAEAANETAKLVEASSEKAHSGASLAESTAQSFVEIVRDINTANDLISKVDESYRQQNEQFSKMNMETGVVQSVVQEMSAASEETAAAAEELASVSLVQETMVTQFKLKNV